MAEEGKKEYSGVNINRVVELLGIASSTQVRNTSYRTRCPICGGTNTTKMIIDPPSGRWYCFGCGRHGRAVDLYSFVVYGKGCESKDEFKKLIKEIEEKVGGEGFDPFERIKPEDFNEHEVAPDKDLNAVYTAMLHLDLLKLVDEDLENLKKRGLSDEAIKRNEYASIAEPVFLEAKKYFKEAKELQKHEQNCRKFQKTSLKNICVGRLISDELIKQGLKLEGVPGFYKVCGKWIYVVTEGLLIPVRSISGKVIGIQTRQRDEKTSKGGLRYITLSSKEYPNGTPFKSRPHFPLAGQKALAEHRVGFTEGPLKADIAAEYSDYQYIALLGVSSGIKIIPTVAEYLAKQGTTEMLDCFDMDRLTNPGVAKISLEIHEALKEKGVKVITRLWDEDGAKAAAEDLRKTAKKFHVIPDPEGPYKTPFHEVSAYRRALV
ncbi:MAG: hypothetical protein K5981_02135, partial [Clostridia bacterium]|nr:hypothetical protein [Clostridia bacterium]